MYTSEEQGVIDIEAEVVSRKVVDTEVIQQEEPAEQEKIAEEVDFNNV